MKESLWRSDCPNCHTRNLVADNGRTIFLKGKFWIKFVINGLADGGLFNNPPSAATCKRCGFHQA